MLCDQVCSGGPSLIQIHHSCQLTNVGGERARQAALHPTAAVSSAERADPFFAGSLSHARGLKRAWDVMHPLFATLMPVPDGLADEQLSAEEVVLAGWPPSADVLQNVQKALTQLGMCSNAASYRVRVSQFTTLVKRKLALRARLAASSTSGNPGSGPTPPGSAAVVAAATAAVAAAAAAAVQPILQRSDGGLHLPVESAAAATAAAAASPEAVAAAVTAAAAAACAAAAQAVQMAGVMSAPDIEGVSFPVCGPADGPDANLGRCCPSIVLVRARSHVCG
jgi:hypothetical protein